MRSLLFIILFLIAAASGMCQETVFGLLKSELKLADTYFEKEDYRQALKLYRHVAKRNPSRDLDLKIARSYHFLKQYEKAVSVYEKHAKNNSLPVVDLYYYAEAQSGISNYGSALKSYQNYLTRVPNDPHIIKKIWRLSNIEYLYEDSMHYSVRRAGFNTSDGELCAVPFRNGIVFMSNRKEFQPIENLDGSRHVPFYKVYFSKVRTDSANAGRLSYETPSLFNREFSSRFHAGPLAFYDNTRRMVFASSADQAGNDGGRVLQLYFAENVNGHWKITYAFPFNNKNYSLSDPWISEDGKVLYFSSDMKGGLGGKDLYMSEKVNNHWTKPVNLGDLINTPQDEVYPYRHGKLLYFSSDGHPGLGGIDIFKAEETVGGFTEPQNLGYPLNTNYDDFGIVIASAGNQGYFSSNRRSGGFNDDIYEFEMDLQTYPLQLNGILKYKEHSWSDSVELKIMPNAKIFLIDNERSISVYENTCDAEGNFSIVIPYFSKFKLRVVSQEDEESIVSLEIPKYKKEHGIHEIVVVKDLFKPK